MTRVQEIIERLREQARPGQVAGMARFGIVSKGRLGVRMPVLRGMAREIGTDHTLALDLWRSGFQESRILAALIDDPGAVDDHQLETWIGAFDSWDVCDQVCMNLFRRVPAARAKIPVWAERPQAFVKRAAFALIACLAVHDKTAADGEFLDWFPLVRSEAGDGRNYVKKAVSWALRNMGKRNIPLNLAAIELARELTESDSKAAHWIAVDVLRELRSKPVQERLSKRSRRRG